MVRGAARRSMRTNAAMVLVLGAILFNGQFAHGAVSKSDPEPVRMDQGQKGIPAESEAVHSSLSAGLGAIAGRVTDKYGVPAVYSCIFVAGTIGWVDANGDFLIENIAPGQYKVIFADIYEGSPVDGKYFMEYYDDKPSYATADLVTVTADSTTTINAVLTRTSRIKGLVTNEGGQPLYNVPIFVFDTNGQEIENEVPMDGHTYTNGYYQSPPLRAGVYKISFDDYGSTFLPEFYDNQSDWDLAASIPIGEGVEITGIDAVLTAVAFGAISGRVTNKEGTGVPQAEVDVYGEPGSTSHAGCYTQEDGSYFISGLLDGNYKIEFHGRNLYFTEFYNDKADMASADLVNVSGGRTTENIDAILARKIEVISPNGGESWQAGTTHQIIWTSTDTIPNVKIELSFDGGGLWSTIVASAPNYGSFTWDIGTTPSLNCVMRISDAYGLGVTDTSDGMFVLTSPPSLTNNYFISPVKWTDATFGDDGWYTGDFDGDGRTDLMRFTEGNMRSEVLLSTGTSFAAPVNWLTAVNGDDGWHIGDFNGDGRDDVLSYVAGLSGGRVFLSDGTQFVNAGSWTGSGCGEDGWYVGDFNGDGKDDLLRYIAEAQRSEVLLSDGTRFTLAGSWSAAWNGTDGWYVGDYNGDGRSDLLRYNPGVSGGEVYFSDGTLFTYGGSWTGAGNGDNGWYLGKFSGTARNGIMRYVLLLSGADVFLNTGSGFTYDGSWTPAGRGDDDWHVGDFNGDGRDDLLRSIVGVTGADVLLSAVMNGGTPPAAAQAGQAGWQNDAPATELSAEDKAFVQEIARRRAGGQELMVGQVQKEYERWTGKRRTRAGIMKLLKRQQKDQPSYRQANSG